MDIRELEVFVAVAEELHFARAAERLHLAQSSVSGTIAKIERELGGAVFDRSNRRVQLTPAGEMLAARARTIIDAMATTVDDVRSLIAGRTGEIHVGYSFSAAFLLQRLVDAVARDRPDITLNPVELYAPLARQALLDGEIDLALLWFAEEHPDLVVRRVAQRPFVAIVRTDDPLAGRDDVDLGDLSSRDFVLSPRTQNPAFYDAIQQRCAAAGFEPVVRQHVGGFRSVRTVISATGGVGVTVDTSTIDVDLGNTTAVEIGDTAPADLHLAVRRNAATAVQRVAALAETVGAD